MPLFSGLETGQAILAAYHSGVYLVACGPAEEAGTLLRRLLIAFCVELTRRAADSLPEYRDRLLDADVTSDEAFVTWWDDASGIIGDLRNRSMARAGDTQAALTWLRHRLEPLRSDLGGELRLLDSRLQEWHARIQSLPRACESDDTVCYRRRLSKGAVLEAIGLLLEKDTVRTELERVTGEQELAQTTLEKLNGFARAEQEQAIAHGLWFVEALIRWLAEATIKHPAGGRSALF